MIYWYCMLLLYADNHLLPFTLQIGLCILIIFYSAMEHSTSLLCYDTTLNNSEALVCNANMRYFFSVYSRYYSMLSISWQCYSVELTKYISPFWVMQYISEHCIYTILACRYPPFTDIYSKPLLNSYSFVTSISCSLILLERSLVLPIYSNSSGLLYIPYTH